LEEEKMKKRYAIQNLHGSPTIHKDSFVFDSENIIGDVRVDRDVVIYPNCNIRADEQGPFQIQKGCNIQDGVTMYGLQNKFVEVENNQYSIFIDSHCSLAHNCMVHGPTVVYKKSFIGFYACVHNSTIGRYCHISQQTIVRSSKIGNRCLIECKAVVCESQVGQNCIIDIGAIVKGVTLPDKTYIPCGFVVDSEEAVKKCPTVSSDRWEEFNKHVVDVNKQLLDGYMAAIEAWKKNRAKNKLTSK